MFRRPAAPIGSQTVYRSVRRTPTRLAVVVLLVAAIVAGCSSEPSGAPSSSTTTSTERSGPPLVRVIGDGNASAAAGPVAAALATTDVVDRSVVGSAPVSWLFLDDPEERGAGANHDALVATNAESPEIVLVSLGADASSGDDADLRRCGSGAGAVDCLRVALDERLLRQRTMAVVFDVLAHTRVTKVVVVGSGGVPGTVAGAVDEQQAAAVLGVAEAGASWAERVVWSPSPGDVVTVLRQRGWV